MNSDIQIFKPKKRSNTKKYKSHSSFTDLNSYNFTPSKDNTRNKNSDITESPSRAIGLLPTFSSPTPDNAKSPPYSGQAPNHVV